MADHPIGSGGDGRHLDARGPREVVYCHQCDNEWFQDTHGLICPRCEGEITEIINPESDPRPALQRSPTPPGFHSLRSHIPWEDDDTSDPEEADIEEHITHGPGGSVIFSQTVRRSTPLTFGSRQRRDPVPQDDPDHVMRDFQSMIGNLMGPQFRPGQSGRSGPDTLFNSEAFPHRMHGGELGPHVVGGRFTFTTTGGRMGPRDAGGPQPAGPPVGDLATYDSPSPPTPNGRSLVVIDVRAPPDQLPRIIGGLFGPMGGAGGPGENSPRGSPGMPPGLQGLQGLFAAMLNPANARAGDAVYSQEALDQIISTLMEQHPTSNAPGPATAESIAALPKKKLDEKLLGPEGKGECSVCMDDVHIGDEVVLLPCSHWFHEACAGAWLSEHNTCPICRKGIDTETPTPNSRRSSQSGPTSRNEHRARRLSATRPRLSRDNTTNSRNEARLDAIRNNGRLTPTEERGPTRWHAVGDANNRIHSGRDNEHYGQMPGSYTSYRRELSENQRDARRGHTSDSDRSRDSRRSSNSGGGGGGGGGGGSAAMSWIRDRLGGSNNRRQD